MIPEPVQETQKPPSVELRGEPETASASELEDFFELLAGILRRVVSEEEA